MKEGKLDSIDPARIAWLLRGDLRRGEPASGPLSDWFKMWWAIHAPREYPAWTDYEALRRAGLFVPVPGEPSHSGFGMTPALQFLLQTREDLAQKFDVSTDQGLWDAIAWLFVHGVREHQLQKMVDEVTLAALDATPPYFRAANIDQEPTITWLMFFVWRTSSDLQTRFDLTDDSQRSAYLEWFLFNGVPNLKLGSLLSQRWRQWLHEPIKANVAATCHVPRAAIMLLERHIQLQRAFDQTTEAGVTGLALWFAEAIKSEPTLAWISEPTVPLIAPKSNRKRPFGLNLIGFAFGELGIGEDVRMAVAACESANIPFVVVNISPGDRLRQADRALTNHVAQSETLNDQAPYAINIFCLTAFDTARVALERGKALLEGRHNIGWWPWELPVWPHDWLGVFDLVDEVWAATQFTHRMYTEAAALASPVPIPVTLMPMAVSVARTIPMTRDALGLPSDSFLFLYVFDFNSYLARKNPLAAVRAFREAFPCSDDSVGLVLKTMNSNPENPEWKTFVLECELDPRIILLDKTLERGEVLGLIQSCDAYVSLHRAEGFGRTLAEAMLLGKPVIATNFSGNVDFLTEFNGFTVSYSPIFLEPGDYPFVTFEDKAWWADPSISHTANQLQRVTKTWNEEKSSVLIKQSKELFSPLHIGEKIKKALNSQMYRQLL